MKEPTIGIDLGTRYAQIAIYEPGKGVSIIPNRWGTLKTSSFVAITPHGILTGEDAARLSPSETNSILWNMKRHLGTDWVARYSNKAYSPEELLLPLLCTLREDAEAYFNKFISSCVLSVPAHFGFPERGALAKTAQLAGFEKVRIVNEPTAAALSVGIDGRFLVLDFGAGTVDISVVEGERGVFQVLESQGRNDIGGVDFDKRLCNWLSEKKLHSSIPIDEKKQSLLLSEAENIKIGLSEALSIQWTVPAGLSKNDYQPLVEVKRSDFETLIMPMIEEVIKMVKSLWRRYAPSRLLLVGGSSRIPLLRQMLASHVYAPERLRMGAEEAVVVGTALYSSQGKEKLMIDVLTRNLGVMNADGSIVSILDRGTPLPSVALRRFTARGFGSLEVTIIQGEGRTRNLNRVLQTLRIDRVTDGEEVEIVFHVDCGGLLHVEVNREMQSVKKTITLDSDELSSPPCDMASEIRLREELIRDALALLPSSVRHRFMENIGKIQNLKNEDPNIQWQAIELIDHTIHELLQVVKR